MGDFDSTTSLIISSRTTRFKEPVVLKTTRPLILPLALNFNLLNIRSWQGGIVPVFRCPMLLKSLDFMRYLNTWLPGFLVGQELHGQSRLRARILINH